MNKRVKKLWIEALTSGEYEQAKSQLRRENSFCCLGVLCDVYRKEVGGRWRIKNQSIPTFEVKGEDEIVFLPTIVRKWAGLETNDPAMPETEDKKTLSAINDYTDYGFPRIAELIGKYL